MNAVVYLRPKMKPTTIVLGIPGVVVIDDYNLVSENRKKLRKNLEFVDDLRKVIDFVDNQDLHTFI